MPTFDLGGSIDDVQKPKLLPDDWYPMVISREPSEVANKTSKEQGAEALGAGQTLIVPLRVYTPEIPEANGRGFTLFLYKPAVGDDKRFNSMTGESIKDMKIKRNHAVAKVFSNKEPIGSTGDLNKGMVASIHVIQQINNSTGELENQIAPFDLPRTYSGPTPDFGDSDIPF